MKKFTVNIYRAHKATQALHCSWNSFNTPIKLACLELQS